MAQITVGRVLDSSTDSVTVEPGAVPLEVKELNVLVPEEFDHLTLAYTGSDLTSVVYRTGGAGGSIVATLTLGYTGSDLTTVART